VKVNTDLEHLAPIFTLTEGAKLDPASGTERDFTTPQSYTVSSQDGNWSKVYKVSFITAELANKYHFEQTKKAPFDGVNYQVFVEKEEDTVDGKEIMEWGSGNLGFAMTASGKPASAYPTSQIDDGYRGKGVQLKTCTTGPLGAAFGSPIAAGNLFIGSFQLDITNVLKSTHFGLPFYHVPDRVVGYYKYASGAVYKEKGTTEVDKRDTFDIYAVFYETSADLTTLDGTNSLEHPAIVSIARIDPADRKETAEWTRFSIPFKQLEGKVIDQEKLKEGKYNISIVFSSSIDGAQFNGAIGSTLLIDEVELIANKEGVIR
jgi:hypothetical protein